MSDVFDRHRALLFGIAYRMLGSVADAEDLVQETWVRWQGVRTEVRDPQAYLARTITNLALNHLDKASVRRERYVGPWLPEPLVTEPAASDDVELAEEISLALMVVMQSLTPLERAVFVLKEVFGFGYGEIAEALDRSESAVRQVGHRARSHVQARRPRFALGAEATEVTERFLAACVGGDLNAMLDVLAPDVTAWTDGGGKVRAALRPLHGADKVARFLLGILGRTEGDLGTRSADVNGQPGLLVTIDGRPDSVVVADVVDGRIAALRLVRNPEKLTGVRIGPDGPDPAQADPEAQADTDE